MTTYGNFEVVVVDNASRSVPTLEYLRATQGRVTVLRDERPFNFSAINNLAVRRTSGEIVCLLNDDTEVISEDWLTEMVSHVLQPGVGRRGGQALLRRRPHPTRRDRSRHAWGGGPFVPFLGTSLAGLLRAPPTGPAHVGRHGGVHGGSTRGVGPGRAVSTSRHLPGAFNDVDFCLRLRDRGWGVVWSPYAELFHHKLDQAGSGRQGSWKGGARGRIHVHAEPVGSRGPAATTRTTTPIFRSTPRISPWRDRLAPRTADHRRAAPRRIGVTPQVAGGTADVPSILGWCSATAS